MLLFGHKHQKMKEKGDIEGLIKALKNDNPKIPCGNNRSFIGS